MCSKEAWGQLVSLTDFETAPLLLITNKYSIGRALDCDLSLSENKLVSGHHCHIDRQDDGTVSLEDTSTNGTLLNMVYKISKGKSKELQHGDEFYIVYKKNNEEANVGFIYQDLDKLLQEESAHSTPDLMDATVQDSDCYYSSPEKTVTIPNSEDESIINERPTKRLKPDDLKGTPDNEIKPNKNSETENKEQLKAGTSDPSKELKQQASGGQVDEGTIEITETVKLGASENPKKDFVKREVESSKHKPVIPYQDDIEENLQCMICQEIMHDCISLQPCLHSYCAGCYSDWMKISEECPSCRKKVQRINKNHMVNNLIEAYLKEHPDKRRPDDDIKELNEKNKITKDMLYPKTDLREYNSSDYSSTDDDDVGCNVGLPPRVPFIAPAVAPLLFGFGTPVFGKQIAKTVCRQCPEYKDPFPMMTNKEVLAGIRSVTDLEGLGKTDNGEEASTSGGNNDEAGRLETSTSGEGSKMPSRKVDVKGSPVAPAHVCPANQNHVLCQCCLQPMPDFRTVGLHCLPPVDKRPQQCSICYRTFCHAYWGCRKADCLGCLDKFKEMNFGRKSLVGLILDNQYESETFRDYIDSQDMSVKDVLQHCCRQMDAGLFSVAAQGAVGFTSDTAVCYTCGVAVFKQLALQYRKSIKKETLPAEVRNRPDCYWGSKCRTQKNKPNHARNFNHICDQTRQF